MTDEPGHQELCDREQAFSCKAIREDLDLSESMDAAVNSLRIVLAAEQSIARRRRSNWRRLISGVLEPGTGGATAIGRRAASSLFMTTCNRYRARCRCLSGCGTDSCKTDTKPSHERNRAETHPGRGDREGALGCVPQGAEAGKQYPARENAEKHLSSTRPNTR